MFEIGDRIKLMRTAYGITQYDLGIALGFDEKSAAIRIYQYESNYRAPKSDLIYALSDALHCSHYMLRGYGETIMDNIMIDLLWMEEEHDSTDDIILKRPDQIQTPDEKPVMTYNPNEIHSPDAFSNPVGLFFNNDVLSKAIAAWASQREKYIEGKVTKEQYFKWKIQWPNPHSTPEQY